MALNLSPPLLLLQGAEISQILERGRVNYTEKFALIY